MPTSTLTTTFHHPFYDITQSAFVDAQNLKPGDELQTPTDHAIVATIHLYHANTVTYDLTIGNLHTYYVVAGSTPVLVHNCGDGEEGVVTPTENGGSWDPAEAPYLYRGVPYADSMSDPGYIKTYQEALQGKAAPRGGHSDVQLHVGGNTDSIFTSWTTDYEDVAVGYSEENVSGPGVVLRIPNADGTGYSRVPGVRYVLDYSTEQEVTLTGTVEGAEISVGGGPWIRPVQ